MKSNIALSGEERRRITAICRREVFEANEKYNQIFDAMILWTLHRTFGFGKERLRRVYEAVHEEYAKLKEYYELDNSEMYYAYLIRLKKDCGIDLEEWQGGKT